MVGFLALIFTAPIFALSYAFARALVLFWPTMILFGAVHSHIEWVPNLSATATFLVVALISLLIPVSSDTDND